MAEGKSKKTFYAKRKETEEAQNGNAQAKEAPKKEQAQEEVTHNGYQLAFSSSLYSITY